jgi:hypothetical protein
MAACFKILQHYDFGFVHQILSFERVHEEAVSANLRRLNSFLLDRLDFIVKYGSVFLNREEIESRFEELLSIYYKLLAVGVVNFKGSEFWSYHRNRMNEIGIGFDYIRLVKASLEKFFDLFFNPKLTIEKIGRRLKSRRKSSHGQLEP